MHGELVGFDMNSCVVGNYTPFAPGLYRSIGIAASEIFKLGEESDWVIEAVRKMGVLATLQPGWDSYGGESLQSSSKSTTVSALQILGSQSLPTPNVVLASDGTVQFEWSKKGKELELGFGKDKSIEFLKVYPNGQISEGKESVNVPGNLINLARWFLAP